MSGLPPRLAALLEQDRQYRAALCRALGLDPGQVVDIRPHPERPEDVARVVMLDRAVEEYSLPAGWWQR